MALSTISNFWTTHSRPNQPRAKIPIVLPTFSYTDLSWLAASRVLLEVDYTLDSRITLSYPVQKPANANYVLAVRLSDGSRYKLWDDSLALLTYPIYAGQSLTTSFSLEVWSINYPLASQSTTLDVPTNSTELDVCSCSSADSEFTGTIDDSIFAALATSSGDPDIALIFDETLPVHASAVPDAPVLSGTVTPPSSATLTWTDVAAELGYKLYRSYDGVTYSLLTTVGPDVLSYVDTFAPTTTLYYKILAYNSIGNSAYSNVVTLTTSFTAYYGRNTNTTVTSSDVLAMTAVTQSGPGGIYSISAGSGYIYFAFPTGETAPVTIKVGAFDFVLETASPYTSTTNSLNWAPVTVGGIPCRIYRSYNTLAGSLNVTIS